MPARARSAGHGYRHEPVRPEDRDQELLLAALADAAELMPVLAALLPEPSVLGPQTGTIGRHAPESSEPWQAQAADAYWRIYFGARKLANRLRREIGLGDRDWGYGLTNVAMAAVGKLAPIVSPQALADARAEVEGWVNGARRIRDIDEVDTWKPLPRPPGSTPPACPYCKTLSLRMNATRQQVVCCFPDCQDLDGKPTRASMQMGRLSDQGQLVFGDGTVVGYIAQPQE